jgi:hypothetical protein
MEAQCCTGILITCTVERGTTLVMILWIEYTRKE